MAASFQLAVALRTANVGELTTQINALIADLANVKQLLGPVIDDLQARSIPG